MSTTPLTDQTVNRWLKTQVAAVRGLTQQAVRAGLIQALAVIGQALILAVVFFGLVIEHQPLSSLMAWWASFPLLILLRAGAAWQKDRAGIAAGIQVRQSLRQTVLHKIYQLGPGWTVGQQKGSLVSQLLEQVDGIEAYVARYLPQQRLAALIPSLILVIVFCLNWASGLVLLVTAPLIPAFMILIGKGAQAVQTRQYQALSRMSGFFLDLLRGMAGLRLIDAQGRQGQRVADVSQSFREKTMRVLRLAFLSAGVLEFFTSLAIALTAVYWGFSLLGVLNFGSWAGAPNLLQALFILLLAPEFYLPMRELGVFYHARAEAQASARQLIPLLEAPSPQVSGGTRSAPLTPPQLEFDRVGFAYRPESPVLQDFSWTVGAASSAAVVGASGVGKTSLFRLLLGQVQPQTGRILVDGQPLESLAMESWRQQIGWMSQQPRLLAATLAENLRVADQSAGPERLRQALDFAGLSDWLARLPAGWETLLGEGGRGLSGGQLRRLALARVWLRDASIVLLDEPTASLDVETKAVILERLDHLRRGRTLLVLTHHTEPLQLMDQVIRLEGGRRC